MTARVGRRPGYAGWPLAGRDTSAVAIASLKNHDVVAIDEVDQPVLLADPSGPAAGEGVAQRLGFADPFTGVPEDVVDEPVDAFEGCPVSREPARVVPPPIGREDEPQRDSGCS